jgi:hypothetical protein
MVYEPAYALLIAVGLALVLPQPGRLNPFAAVGPAARGLARDLPKSGPWAAPAGILLLVLIAAPAVAVTWALTSWLPQALRLFAPDASPIVVLILSAVVLRLTFRMPPVWAWRRSTPAESPQETEGRPPFGSAPVDSARDKQRGQGSPLQRIGAELVAPVMLFALVGIYAPVVYRVALEVTRDLTDPTEERIAAPAGWVAYIPAYPAGRLALLFALVTTRGGAITPVHKGGPRPSVAAGVLAAAGGILLALLVTVW